MAPASKIVPVAHRSAKFLGETTMPDSPAQSVLILSNANHGATTERMATPEELLALQLLEEEENSAPPVIVAEPELDPVTTECKSDAASEPDLQEPASQEPKFQATVEAVPPLELALEPTVLSKASSEESPDEKHATAQTHVASSAIGSMFELAAVLDQHNLWVESGGEEGTK